MSATTFAAATRTERIRDYRDSAVLGQATMNFSEVGDALAPTRPTPITGDDHSMEFERPVSVHNRTPWLHSFWFAT